jgi:hypothetical protein
MVIIIHVPLFMNDKIINESVHSKCIKNDLYGLQNYVLCSPYIIIV